MVNLCHVSRILKVALAGGKTKKQKPNQKQVRPRHRSNGLVLNSPEGLIKGGSSGNVFVIGPSVNTYLDNVYSKWPEHSIQDITEIL